MKSAYEIAMEKLNKAAGPTRKLSEAQKKRMADIDASYDARIAEARLSREQKMAVADPAEREEIQKQLTEEIGRLEEQREREKEAIWNEAE